MEAIPVFDAVFVTAAENVTGVPDAVPPRVLRSGWDIWEEMTWDQRNEVLRRLSATPDHFSYRPEPRRQERAEMTTRGDGDARTMNPYYIPAARYPAGSWEIGNSRDEYGALAGCGCAACHARRDAVSQQRGSALVPMSRFTGFAFSYASRMADVAIARQSDEARAESLTIPELPTFPPLETFEPVGSMPFSFR